MLNRRQIRAKVMQNIYAINKQNSDAIDIQEKFMIKSFEDSKQLYLFMISILIELQKLEQKKLEFSARKHLATNEDLNPNTKFVDNKILKLLINSEELNKEIDVYGVNLFSVYEQYIVNLMKEIKESDIYTDYISTKESSFENDQKFVVDIYTEIIATNNKVYEFIEDQKLTWIDDYPVINTKIIQQISRLKPHKKVFGIAPVFKDIDDKIFGIDLFKKTILNFTELIESFKDKTKKWDIERIADIDVIIICLCITELKNFPSIPIKVSINEYIELTKDYSTPKSKSFINGILNVIVTELNEQKLINKTGRGLIQ